MPSAQNYWLRYSGQYGNKRYNKSLSISPGEQEDKQSNPFHHLDSGMQYFSREYVELSEANGDPKNALAERMNRTIKEESSLGEMIETILNLLTK